MMADPDMQELLQRVAEYMEQPQSTPLRSLGSLLLALKPAGARTSNQAASPSAATQRSFARTFARNSNVRMDDADLEEGGLATYLSTAPVLLTALMSSTAAGIIVLQYLFPDTL